MMSDGGAGSLSRNLRTRFSSCASPYPQSPWGQLLIMNAAVTFAALTGCWLQICCTEQKSPEHQLEESRVVYLLPQTNRQTAESLPVCSRLWSEWRSVSDVELTEHVQLRPRSDDLTVPLIDLFIGSFLISALLCELWWDRSNTVEW